MEYSLVNNFPVSRLAFGCEPLGGTDWGTVDVQKVVAAIHRALERGINVFDTANVYGLGLSEERLSQTLGHKRHEVCIISKFGVNWSPGSGRAQTFFDSRPEHVMEALEGSLRRLRIESLPIYLIHWRDPHTALEATLSALAKCQQAGKIQAVGVSNFTAADIREAHQILPLAMVEVPYNLFQTAVKAEVLPTCQTLGIPVFAYGVLAQGLLTGKVTLDTTYPQTDRRSRLPHFSPENRTTHLHRLAEIQKAANHHHKTLSQVAIRWVLDDPVIASAIVGVKSISQLEENIGALGWHLDERNFFAGA